MKDKSIIDWANFLSAVFEGLFQTEPFGPDANTEFAKTGYSL